MSTCDVDVRATNNGLPTNERSQPDRVGCRVPRAIAVAAISVVQVFSLARAHAEPAAVEPLPHSATSEQVGGAATVSDVERDVLELLSEGRQSEAEHLLDVHTGEFPDALEFMRLLSSKETQQAEQFLAEHTAAIQRAQRPFFLYAVCHRSRFNVPVAQWVFYTVTKMNPETLAGKCAFRIVRLDTIKLRGGSRQELDTAFANMRELVDSHPDDVIMRWMLAVQCRNWNRNAEGAELYKQILEKWNPGPVLLHQTYANLLDQLGRYDESLAQRRIAVDMEPAPWSYDGLGNTLYHLERYQEGHEAHAIAVQMSPNRASYWANWAWGLMNNNQLDEAIEKAQRAVQIDPSNIRAWNSWIKSLQKQGKHAEALAVLKRSSANSEAQRKK